MSWRRTCGAGSVILALVVQIGGCPLGAGVVTQGLLLLEQTAVIVQDVDPRDIVLPDSLVILNDSVVIEPDVVVITDIQTQLAGADPTGDTVLGFTNVSGSDLFIEFQADGVVQDIFVLDGDTLLLDFPCLSTIDLLESIEVDPVTGDVLTTLDLTGLTLFNPQDFICGDSVLMTFNPDSVTIGLDVIDLLQ